MTVEPNRLQWSTLVLACILAASATAQQGPTGDDPTVAAEEAGTGEMPAATPSLDTAEGFAALALAACLRPAPGAVVDGAVLEAAGFAPAEDDAADAVGTDETEEDPVTRFAAEGGVTLSLDRAGGAFACEMVLPKAGRPSLERDGIAGILMRELSPAIGTAYEVVATESVEEGQVWRAAPSEGIVLEARFQDLGDRIVLTSVTREGPALEDSE